MFYIRKSSALIILLFFCSSAILAQQNEVLVSDVTELKAAIQNAKPNDLILLKKGVWNDLDINFNSKATASQPISLQSEALGKVILTGSSKITISSPHLIVNGFLFGNGSINNGSIITIKADSCKVRNIAILNYNPSDSKTAYNWVLFKGSYNIVENCFFKGKNNDQQVIVNSEENAKYNIIRNCTFKDIPLIKNNNGREIIKIVGFGHSDQNGADGAYCTVENNLFENADGESTEIISIKSNHNVVRNNTILSSCGGLVNRRGSNNVFENNIIIGKNKPRTLGIRIANNNNRVVNNYISDVAESGIVLMTGEYTDSFLTKTHNDPKSMKSGKMVREPKYGAVKNCNISNNTIVNSALYGIDIGYGYKKNWGQDQMILLPEENTIKNNLIINSKIEGIHTSVQDKKKPLDTFVFKPNVLESNILLTEIKPVLNNDALFNSEKKTLDTGAEQIKLHVLKASEVGPNWMKH